MALARIGFTMAEILLSLTIIGVVAAITLPSLTGNINERTWNTQRKALYARMSQAIALMPALNGYGTLQEMTDSTTGSTSIEDTAAETFVTAGLSKVLKINNICDSEHLEDCGIPDKINPFSGNSVALDDINTLHGLSNLFKNPDCSALPYCYSQIDTKVSAIETQNGESILVYYNPKCSGLQSVYETYFFPQPRMCANFVYDLNGSKGPNTMGKDIGFMTAFYPADPVVVAPQPLASDITSPNAMLPFARTGKSCLAIDADSRVPNLEEMISIIFNAKIIGNLNNPFYWSSSLGENGWPWNITSTSARVKTDPKTTAMSVRCIKR